MTREIFTFTTLCVILCSCAKKNDSTFVQENDFIFIQGNEKVSDFYICEHEVTQVEYQRIMGTNPSKTIDDNNPVDGVTWYEAAEYCNKRSEDAGLTPCYSGLGEKITCNFEANGYRLPTETEWEYAARGGNSSKGYKYSGSDDASDVAWHYDNSDMKSHNIKTKLPNELGIYDMSGNVCEWCWDRMGNEYPSSIKNYAGPETGDCRVCRGGSFYLNDTNSSIEHRINYQPYVSSDYFGFRVVRSSHN